VEQRQEERKREREQEEQEEEKEKETARKEEEAKEEEKETAGAALGAATTATATAIATEAGAAVDADDAADGVAGGVDAVSVAVASSSPSSSSSSSSFEPVDPSLFREDPDDGCHANEHTEYWGDLTPGVAQGAGNKLPSAAECCAACKKAGPTCNAWVWDPGSEHCFLKKLTNAYQPANINPGIKFTSGVIYPPQPRYVPVARGRGGGGAGGGDSVAAAETSPPPYCLHTMITSNGQPYMNWQTRVFHATWKKVAKVGGGIIVWGYTSDTALDCSCMSCLPHSSRLKGKAPAFKPQPLNA
jgi:hypothetical protein